MSDVLVEHRSGVAWITLNRPDARNALSRDVNLQLKDLADELEDRDDVRAIVITGSGDKAFCAGADLKERRGVSAAETGPYLNAIAGAINAWAESLKPTVCAMNGSAYGGGLELALACDFRILVEGADVGLTEVKLGIMPGAGGTQRLPRLVGEARAKEMILLCRRLSASEALAWGLVNRLVPKDANLIDDVLAWIEPISQGAPLAQAAALQAIDRAHDTTLELGLELEKVSYDTVLVSEDRREALEAFANKRKPNFRGK